ncbi:hypothetical protein MTR67_012283 [Solanum verrucosum]|uniref:Uncharacterized protein n=1 Tax=Solanum verrucosum TaxID=315347 RepID=A0AAF0Q9F6_SOLVR|nr:hypothetical protein MTR67_012283 [Solanum verrucosum]
MTKSAHLIPIKKIYSTEDYAKLYMREMVMYHGVPVSIISNRKFIYIFRCTDKISNEHDFPNNFASLYQVFHVSLLKKCVGDPTSIAPLEGVG